MIKRELRKIYEDKRNNLSEQDAVRLDSLLLIQFQQLSLGDIRTVLSYWPIHEKSEVNTHLMTDYLSFMIPGLQLAYPVMHAIENTFKPVLVSDETHYQKNRYGVSEPVSADDMPVEGIDLVFVPLLAFDTNGFRVGYGKGFYDRFLSGCREDTIKIGFSYFEPEPAIDDISEFDVPLNVCIIPNKVYEF